LNSITNFIRFKNTQKEKKKPSAVTKPAIHFGSGILVVLITVRRYAKDLDLGFLDL
jgi:hypothetical protein